MIVINTYNIGNFICKMMRYSLGYGFKIYYKEVKRGKHVAGNFVYFKDYGDCKNSLFEQLEQLKTIQETNGSVSLEAWYNSYKA